MLDELGKRNPAAGVAPYRRIAACRYAVIRDAPARLPSNAALAPHFGVARMSIPRGRGRARARRVVVTRQGSVVRSAYTAAAMWTLAQLPADMRERRLQDHRHYDELWRSLIMSAKEAGELDPDLDPHAARTLLMGAVNWARSGGTQHAA